MKIYAIFNVNVTTYPKKTGCSCVCDLITHKAQGQWLPPLKKLSDVHVT